MFLVFIFIEFHFLQAEKNLQNEYGKELRYSDKPKIGSDAKLQQKE